MLDYLKARIGERSTSMGITAIALALGLVIVPLVVSPEKAALVSANLQWLIGALFVGGLGGVLFPDKPK